VTKGTTDWLVRRWDEEQVTWARKRRGGREPGHRDFSALHLSPYLVTEYCGNVITNAGYQALLASATTGGTPLFTASKGRLGVGSSTTAATAADTHLGGDGSSTTCLYKFMSAAPVIGTGTNKTWTFTATFQASDFNQSWQEFGIDQGTADGTSVTAVFLNHAISNQGTKTSGQVWTATATLSFS
jgi:hypothetical protein